jgi:hypothetical protein
MDAGVSTREGLIEATGLTSKTVMSALNRAAVNVEHTWPRRYTLVRSAFLNRPVQVVHETILEPTPYDASTVGKVWQAGRTKIGVEIADTDLSKLDRDEALSRIETLAASLLGVVVALRSVEDSPEWHEQIGLT